MIDGAYANVKDFGAVGNGVADDTTSIQEAIDSGASTIYVPNGTYMIEAVTAKVRLKSNQTLLFESGASFKAITTSSGGYDIIYLNEISNVQILNATVIGERSTHTGVSGEFGFGIAVYGCTDVLIDNVNVSDCWGDGVYLGSGRTTANKCKDITIINSTVINNRRNNISVTFADYVSIVNCKIRNANGTAPEAGIDLEPNAGQEVNNVVIDSCDLSNNARQGLLIFIANGPVKNVFVTNCILNSNVREGILAGGENLNVEGCVITNNGRNGLWAQFVDRLKVSGCTITGNATTNAVADFYMQGCTSVTVEGCYVKTNTTTSKPGLVYFENGTDLQFSNCVLDGSNTTENVSGMYLKGVDVSAKISNCEISNIGSHGITTEGAIASLIVSCNEIKNVSRRTNTTFNYIQCTCDSVTINGNVFKTTTGNKPLYGVRIFGDNNIITSNFIRDYQGGFAIRVESPSTGLISVNNYTSAT
jgi:polygalacturonase